MSEVIWKDIPGYEGYYIISSKGVILSLRHSKGVRKIKRVVSQSLNNGKDVNSYWSTNLWKNNNGKHLFVHRLLALAFIPNPENKEHVNHIDLNKLNNDLSNLEWVTRRENFAHYYRSFNDRPIGAKPVEGRWEAQVSVNNKTKYLGRFTTQQEAGDAYKAFLLTRNENNRYG